MQLYSKVNKKIITFKTLDELIPSTITALFPYDGQLNLDNIFRTFVTEIKESIDEEEFGVIFLRYKKETRGFDMKNYLEDKDYFKKSVTIGVMYKGDKISIKLAENIFHICGLKSIELGFEVIDKLKEKIQESQRFVEFLRKNTKKLERLIWAVKNKCLYKNNKVVFPFTIIKLDYQEQIFIDMIFRHANYAPSLEWYINHFDKLMAIREDTVIQPSVVLQVIPIMRNYIYSIGRPINRIVLALIVKTESNFIVKYNNSTQHFVRVKIPFSEQEMMADSYKKSKKKRYHHFLIHKTGTITQTGREIAVIKDLFCKLMAILEKYYDNITDMSLDFLVNQLDDSNEYDG